MSLPAYRSADPARTYYAYNGAWAFLSALTFTLSMVYYVRDAGLDPLQMVLVGTTLELACFLFEVPTGLVADLYSRRLSIIIGVALIGAGFLLQGLVPAFLGDPRRPGALGPRLHLHLRRRPGLDHRRDRDRTRGDRCSSAASRSAWPRRSPARSRPVRSA